MSSGCDNPITIHSVDDKLFRAVWALIAETMCVTTVIRRSTKEAISELVSERNNCPVCINAHSMMGTLAFELDKKDNGKNRESQKATHKAALKYAEFILEEMDNKRKEQCADFSRPKNNSSQKKETDFSLLNDVAKAEIALVVMLFDHMNRVVSVVMGEEMSTAMFSVPRSVAKVMEKRNLIRFMSRWMSPVLSGAFKAKANAGLTLSLFGKKDVMAKSRLPDHLQGLLLAGLERANAVGRLMDWVDTYEKDQLVENGLISSEIVDYLDKEIKCFIICNYSSPKKVLEWVEKFVKTEVSVELNRLADNDAGVTVVTVLMLSTFAPQMAYQSKPWNDLVGYVGSDMARCIVMWWSLRTTLQDATGLDEAIDKKTLENILCSK